MSELILPAIIINITFLVCCSLLIICGQTSLPEHHRVLAWEWLLRDSLRVPVEGEEVEVDSGSPMDQSSQSYEMELRQRVLLPSMFDSLGV